MTPAVTIRPFAPSPLLDFIWPYQPVGISRAMPVLIILVSPGLTSAYSGAKRSHPASPAWDLCGAFAAGSRSLILILSVGLSIYSSQVRAIINIIGRGPAKLFVFKAAMI